MARTQDPNLGKPLYAKKGETVLYYKDQLLTKQELGISAKDGNLVGAYVLATQRLSGTLVYGIAWPSDSASPVRYVKASQTEWISYKASDKSSVTVDLTKYDPAKDAKNRQPATPDNSLLYLILVLIGVVMYKFNPRL